MATLEEMKWPRNREYGLTDAEALEVQFLGTNVGSFPPAESAINCSMIIITEQANGIKRFARSEALRRNRGTAALHCIRIQTSVNCRLRIFVSRLYATERCPALCSWHMHVTPKRDGGESSTCMIKMMYDLINASYLCQH